MKLTEAEAKVYLQALIDGKTLQHRDIPEFDWTNLDLFGALNAIGDGSIGELEYEIRIKPEPIRLYGCFSALRDNFYTSAHRTDADTHCMIIDGENITVEQL